MKKLLVIFSVFFILFSCSNKRSINIPKSNSLIGTYTLNIPDLDPEQYAPTHVYIELEIQGGIYPFIIDTGDRSGTLKISKKTSEKIEHILTGKTRESKNLYRKNQEVYCKISDINIGNHSIDNLSCEISEDSWFWPWSTVHEDIGFIGWGLLREFNLYIDYPNNIISFYSHGTLPPEFNEWDYTEYQESNNMISLSGTFNGSPKKYSLLIDSGAGLYTVDDEGESIFLDSLFPKKYRKVQSYSKPITENILQNEFIAGDVRINKMNVGSMSVPWFLSYRYDGFMGWEFFWNHPIFFDNMNQGIYVK